MELELELRLLRARVWLSRRALDAHDGFLAVTRAAERLEKLSFGSLDAQAQCSARKFDSAAIKWAAPTTPAALHVAHAERALPRIEFLLFVLQKAPERQQQQRQRIAFVGRSALRLRAEDLDALRSQHEIVFSTALDGGLGSLDVKVSTRSAAAGDEAGGGGGGSAAFSVNWSSSEALQRDLADKARLQAEGEATLLLQLRKVLARALHAVAVRDRALQRRRLWWAAVRIQRAFRGLLRRQLELRDRARRERLAQQEARKARARTAVVERNLRRAQTMRAQLFHHAAPLAAPAGGGDLDARDLAQSIRTQAEAHERERLRRALASISSQSRAAASHAAASEHVPVSSSKAAGGAALDAELVRGIRSLYFGANVTLT